MNGDFLFNPEAIAWVIAAEGTITVARSSGRFYYPFVQVTNTSKEFIDEFHKMVDFGTVWVKGNNNNPKHKVCYCWSLRNLSGCLSLLNTILQYLPIKIEQAKLAIELCESRLKDFHKIGRNNLFSEREMEIVNRIHKLNMKGRGG